MSGRPSDHFKYELSAQGLKNCLENQDAKAVAKYLDRKESVEFLWSLHKSGDEDAELCHRALTTKFVIGGVAKYGASRLLDLICDRSDEKQIEILSQPSVLLFLVDGTSVERVTGVVEPLDAIAPGKILTAENAAEALTLKGDAEPLVRMIRRHPLPLQLEILLTGYTAGRICRGGQAAAMVEMIDDQCELRNRSKILTVPYLLENLIDYGQKEAAIRLTGEQPESVRAVLATSEKTAITLKLPKPRYDTAMLRHQ